MKKAVKQEFMQVCKDLKLLRDMVDDSFFEESWEKTNIYSFLDDMAWIEMSDYEYLTEDFMQEFHRYLDWDLMSMTQKLSEELIWKFRDKVDWENIAACQKLRDEFIYKISTFIDDDDFQEIFIKSGMITQKQLEKASRIGDRYVEHIDIFADEFDKRKP